jgi:hypothetical protein
VRSDQCSLSTAIEAYFADHEAYPAWSMAGGNDQVGPTWNYRVAEFWEGMLAPAALPSFAMNSTATASSYMTLTTPMAYITSYPVDPFTSLKGMTFVYWSINPGENDPSGKITGTETHFGWILVSPGPDGVYDIPAECEVYDPSIPQPSARFLTGSNRFGGAFTYDPTNGTISSGDIWRVKQ